MIALTGTGTAPAKVLSPTQLAFGEVLVGQSSALTLTIGNTGTADLIVSDIVLEGPYTHNANLPLTIPPGEDQAVEITFTPTAAGAQNGTLTLTCNDGSAPAVVPLTGTGTTPTKALNPTQLAFGEVLVGQASTLSLTISNTGSADLVVSDIALEGPYTHNATLPMTIPPGEDQAVEVTFTPTATGAQNGTLTLTCNDGGTPVAVPLTGTGTTPTKALNPTQLAFGGVLVGQSSAQTLTISNTGSADLVVSNIALEGPYTHNATLPLTIPPGEDQAVEVTFTPAATGAQNGTLTLTCNDGETPAEIALTGTGTAPAKVLSPNLLAFGNVLVGQSSIQTLTISNIGSADLVVSDIALEGPYTHNATLPLTIVPAGSQVVQVTFTPTAAGGQNNTLTLTCNDDGAPTEVDLTGTGTNPPTGPGPNPDPGTTPGGGPDPSTAPEKTLSTTQLAFRRGPSRPVKYPDLDHQQYRQCRSGRLRHCP